MTDVIASPNFLAYFNTNSTSPIIGAINSTFSGGAVFGALMGGLTMDRFGRKKTVQIGALIAAVGAILQCAAVDLAMILVGRIISGWAVGLMSMSVPVYQAECAHPRMRVAFPPGVPSSAISCPPRRSLRTPGVATLAYRKRSQRGSPWCPAQIAWQRAGRVDHVRVRRDQGHHHGGKIHHCPELDRHVQGSAVEASSYARHPYTGLHPIDRHQRHRLLPDNHIRGRGNAFATGIGNFVFVAFNILVTIPTIFFLFKETTQLSLEEIDLLFGDRALGTLPNELAEKDIDDAIRTGSVAGAEKNAAVTASHEENAV
ncbi:hypothetical protein M8818_007688 [Zalaria obscura]|uniref:Uncharacterized protein n=1 Tax=Zalaria obscura TaxID=2024903 RepID=A0ACC3S5Z9_9PEZI